MVLGWSIIASLLLGCNDDIPSARANPATASAAASSAVPPPARSFAKAVPSGEPTQVAPSQIAPHCPEGMALVPGGSIWIGSNVNPEESPRFKTQVASFCADLTEVTVDAYAHCVKSGSCKPGRVSRHFCNAQYPDRGKHPINCVDWHQAKAYCQWKQARLPDEVEWEYAARGGEKRLLYPWGDTPPDDNTCWKHAGTCEVKSYPAGAFGLFDVVGNVWEWTSSGFGDYPWPPVRARLRVYRGGAWSRRFVKWMRPRLRNRYAEDKWGSHIGIRCVATPKGTECPYGSDTESGGCKRGVLEMECAPGTSFNGQRCARKGEPVCPQGYQVEPGHGCVLAVAPAALGEAVATPVTHARTPKYDADCAKHYPGRPSAYRYGGGTHAERNQVSARAGCSNRDVGVGWNSTCCP